MQFRETIHIESQVLRKILILVASQVVRSFAWLIYFSNKLFSFFETLVAHDKIHYSNI